MAGTEAIYQQLTILLALATLSHFTIKRFHQPTIVGEIALGILLGPTILLHYLQIQLFDPNFVSTFAGLGAIFLLFLIGLESDFKAIYTRKNVVVAARITDQARGGEILASAVVKQLTESAGDIRFEDAREVELDGLAGTHDVYKVV